MAEFGVKVGEIVGASSAARAAARAAGNAAAPLAAGVGGESDGARGRAVGPRALASARDRARLRERQAAERARVEEALARGPRGPVGAPEPRERHARDAEALERPRVRPSRFVSRAPASAVCVCRLCGGSEVALDAVFERGTWQLARCRRCDFMWTERGARPGDAHGGEAFGRRFERFAPRTRRPATAGAAPESARATTVAPVRRVNGG